MSSSISSSRGVMPSASRLQSLGECSTAGTGTSFMTTRSGLPVSFQAEQIQGCKSGSDQAPHRNFNGMLDDQEAYSSTECGNEDSPIKAVEKYLALHSPYGPVCEEFY